MRFYYKGIMFCLGNELKNDIFDSYQVHVEEFSSPIDIKIHYFKESERVFAILELEQGASFIGKRVHYIQNLGCPSKNIPLQATLNYEILMGMDKESWFESLPEKDKLTFAFNLDFASEVFIYGIV